MSFFTKIRSAVTSYNKRLKSIADKQAQAADRRAKARMEQATTRTEKLRAKAQAAREKEKVYKELAEAQESARKAASALNRARKEAGDLTGMEKLRSFGTTTRKSLSDFQRGLQGASGRGTGSRSRGRRTVVKKRE